MSRKAYCYDNTLMESFWATLKALSAFSKKDQPEASGASAT